MDKIVIFTSYYSEKDKCHEIFAVDCLHICVSGRIDQHLCETSYIFFEAERNAVI